MLFDAQLFLSCLKLFKEDNMIQDKNQQNSRPNIFGCYEVQFHTEIF